MLKLFRKGPPVDASGFKPGDLMVTIQKRDKLPVWARSLPRRIKVSDNESTVSELQHIIGPDDILMYVACVEEPKRQSNFPTLPALLFLNVVWKHGSHWVSSADAEFMLISD